MAFSEFLSNAEGEGNTMQDIAALCQACTCAPADSFSGLWRLQSSLARSACQRASTIPHEFGHLASEAVQSTPTGLAIASEDVSLFNSPPIGSASQ